MRRTFLIASSVRVEGSESTTQYALSLVKKRKKSRDALLLLERVERRDDGRVNLGLSVVVLIELALECDLDRDRCRGVELVGVLDLEDGVG